MTANPQDPLNARSIPDEYAKLRAPSGTRVLELVGRKWGDRAEGDQRELAQILMLILEPLQRPGAEVTDALRTACEQAVADWIEKTVAIGESADGPHRSMKAGGGSGGRPRRAVRVVTAEAIALDGDQYSARVTLDRAGRRHTITAACTLDAASQVRGGATATLGALRQVLGHAALAIDIVDVSTFEARGRTGVIVTVDVTEAGRRETLVGVHPDMGTEPVRAATLAVLNAVNRRLGIG